MHKILSLLLLLGVVSASFADQSAIPLAIVGIQTDPGVDTIRTQVFMDNLKIALTKRSGFQIIDSARVDSAKKAQGLSARSFCDNNCLQKISQSLGIDKLLTVQAGVKDGNDIKLSIALYDGTAGNVEKIFDLERADPGLAVRLLSAYLMPSEPGANEGESEKLMPAWHPANSDSINGAKAKVTTRSSVDLTQFGVVLGGSYSWFSGSGANNMGMLIDSTYSNAIDNLNPFGYVNDPSHAKAQPSGALGPIGGVYLRMDWNDYIYMRVELNYVWKGAEYSKTLSVAETYTADTTMLDSIRHITQKALNDTLDTLIPGTRRYDITDAYLELPILLGVNITRDFSIYAGPQFSYLLTHDFTAYFTQSEITNIDYTPLPGKKTYPLNVKTSKFDVGLLLGANYAISEQVQIGLRYELGFLPIFDRTPKPNITTQAIQLVASLNFSRF